MNIIPTGNYKKICMSMNNKSVLKIITGVGK